MNDYFDQPRRTPRYEGASDPVGKHDQTRVDLATRQAIHRAYLDWAASHNREHWIPSDLTVEVANSVPDLFIRNKVAIVARMVGKPVLPVPPDPDEKR